MSIGRLGAPKGVRGDLKVHSHSGESDHFRKLRQVELRGDSAAAGAPRSITVKVTRVEGHGSSLTMAFEGYGAPETARVLTGMEVIVPRAAASPLKPNQWYIDDLVGLAIVDAGCVDPSAKGRKLGEVRSVLDGGAEPWLEVALPGGQTAIVPFRNEFVGGVDLAGATIELLVPELLAPGLPDE